MKLSKYSSLTIIWHVWSCQKNKLWYLYCWYHKSYNFDILEVYNVFTLLIYILYLTTYYYVYRENDERLILLETLKEPYLFTSSNLEKIVNITVSLKTRMSMIGLIGPRLTDPNAKISIFTDMFRFSEDKKSVEDILKARTNTLNASQFKRYDNSIEHHIIIKWWYMSQSWKKYYLWW